MKPKFISLKGLRDELEAKGIQIDDGAYQAGKLVFELRTLKQMTQEQFARFVDEKQSSVARVESMMYYPTVKYLEKICRKCGVKLTLEWHI